MDLTIEANAKLREELMLKLQIYSAYLPLKSGEATFKPGKDPISVRDKIIAEKDKLLKLKESETEELKKMQVEEFVPRVLKEKTDGDLISLQVNLSIHQQEHFKTLGEENAKLQSTIINQDSEIKELRAGVVEKDRLYQFLLTEYSEMCANMAGNVGQANNVEGNGITYDPEEIIIQDVHSSPYELE